MGRMYKMSFEDVAVAAAQDLFQLKWIGPGVYVLHGLYLSQTSELGDAAEEMLLYKIQTGATADGSGGNSGVELPLGSLGDGAVTAIGRINDTTESSGGTIVDKHVDAFNIRTGLIYLPPPAQRISWSANRLAVALISVPTDSITMSGTIIWEEIS